MAPKTLGTVKVLLGGAYFSLISRGLNEQIFIFRCFVFLGFVFGMVAWLECAASRSTRTLLQR